MIRIKDLARSLGLSITTVSRALDGYPDVAEETRRRVVAAAQALGYVPSAAARQLRRQRADAVGFVLPASTPRFSDPFHSMFVAGLCDEAAVLRMDVVVASAAPGSPEEQWLYQRWVEAQRVDGVVLNRVRVDDWRIRFLQERSVPFAALGGALDAEYPCVVVKERQAMQQMVEHLLLRGYRRIGFLGGPSDLLLQQERFGGYCDGLRSAGMKIEPAWVVAGDLTEDGGYAAAQHLLDKIPYPMALIGCNDWMALGALRAVVERGLFVGRDVAVGGYDGLREGEFSNPQLTTLEQPTYEIARRLMRRLHDWVYEERQPEPVEIIEPVLRVRASTLPQMS